MSFKKYCLLNEYLREQIEKQNIINKYIDKEPLIDEYVGIENINNDLVVWYKKDGELDCWIMWNYFKGYYKDYTNEQVYKMWLEELKI